MFNLGLDMAPRLNSQQVRDVVGLTSEIRHVESGCKMYDLTIFDKTAFNSKKLYIKPNKCIPYQLNLS